MTLFECTLLLKLCMVLCTHSHVLIAILFEILVPALVVFQQEISPLRLEMSWLKPLVHTLGFLRDEPPSLLLCGHDISPTFG